MKKAKKKASKITVAVIITAVVFVTISFLHFVGAFRFLENQSYDLRVRLTAPYLRTSDDIIVILIDQDSIDWGQQERGWPWPWPRRAYAEIIEYMNIAGAKSVAFDIIYGEPSVHGPDDDVIFAHASQEFGRAVQGVFFASQLGSFNQWPSGLDSPLFQPVGFGNFIEQFGKGGDGFPLTGALFPIQGLRDSAGALSSVTGVADSDDIYRRVRLFTLFDGKAVPGMAAASLLVDDHTTEISFDQASSTIRWDNFTIPVDHNGKSLLRFRGSLERYILYSAKNVLISREAYLYGEDPLYPPEEFFAGSHVFVGLFGPGLFDIFSSPISSTYPGIGMHITLLDNLLAGDFNRESRTWFNLLILFAVVSLTVALCLFSRHVAVSISSAVVITLGIIIGAFAAYRWGGIWIPAITFLAGTAAAFVSSTLYNYTTEGSQKRFIKSAFSQYLSPKVIERIIADPSQLNLGGEKRELTAIFTDIRSFSTIAEALGDPVKLVELLNHYLTRMSNFVLENEGTIDKYIGDAIVAFFGAPIHFDNHASLACHSAVQMKKAEIDINREAIESGLISDKAVDSLVKKGIITNYDDPVPLYTRIGVNTGEMVVGNMGTSNKMDYTIMGNAVNLTARIEGVNKPYCTGGLLISEYTKNHIGDEFIVRPLSRVRVVGINAPLRLYELLDISKDAPPSLTEMVTNWEKAFALYENRDFTAAASIFHGIFLENTGDLTAQMYYNRCCKYTDSPPNDVSWDGGVDNLTEK